MQDLGIDEIRKKVAIVPQKAMLFSGSIADNIRWGKQNATKEAVTDSLHLAEGGFVLDMPEGTDSMLGSGGVNLSGGQKQRISIARGTIKDAALLILDDSMSALDAITEAKVRDNLKRRAQKQTLITITQRCGTAMLADKILVLDNGKNIGIGTHEELMQTCPVYIDLYRTQMESSKEIYHG
jgi:ATP-binding cassette subfamily B protein